MKTTEAKTQWQYLEQRPHPWRQQLYIKGKRLRAFTVWMDMIVNEMSAEEVAESKEIPLAAVHEAIEYCETHRTLLQQEAEKERHYLEAKGISLEPKITN